MTLTERWLSETWADPRARELVAILTEPTGRTAGGWPYLQRHAWVRFRDWVPHHLDEGARVLSTVERLLDLLERIGPTEAERETIDDAVAVIRQVVMTAQITAPPDLWLLRHVLGSLRRIGVLERFERGEVVRSTPELEPDLQLLLARGYLARAGEGYRWGDVAAGRAVLTLPPLADRPVDLSWRWAEAFSGERRHDAALAELGRDLPRRPVRRAPTWVATPEDIELGYRLVPLVLGLRASHRIGSVLESGRLELGGAPGEAARAILARASALSEQGELTATGRRMLERGPGPFGIIEAYHPYLAQLDRILTQGQASVHVVRSANVAASQDANRRTFQKANDALDAFCEATGFRYDVFVEHAVGRGEAIRQRWQRSGDSLAYVGADLEPAAIEAAREEQRRGRLPPDVRFVSGADIGEPETLVRWMQAEGLSTEGAVMLVGNGFHEVRHQTDERMIEVFRGYERAGFVLLFTEESALATDDLLNTAWNTYHAGFRYVHHRSGQGLRPALPTPPSRLGASLPTSWTECAQAAGYVRADPFSSRSRTIYPYTPANGVNPSISVNHFFVPARIAAKHPW